MPNLNDLDDRWPTEDPTPEIEEEEDGRSADGKYYCSWCGEELFCGVCINGRCDCS